MSPILQTDSVERTGFTPLNNAIRVTLLAQMLGVQSEQIAIHSDVDVNLRVKNEQEYKAQLTPYVDREEAKFRAVKRELLAKQLLSPDEAADDAVLPSLLLVVRDDRSAKDFPLG